MTTEQKVLSSTLVTRSLERALSCPPPWIMGILNITPDSFSDGGEYTSPQEAVAHAEQLVSLGANIIDLGAESTAPGSSPVAAQEEIRRISEVLGVLTSRVFLSIDTYKAEVAEYCLSHGARMINDVSGMRADPAMCDVIKKHGSYVIIMHSKESAEHPGATESAKDYRNVVGEIIDFLEERVRFALERGISPDKIVIDPGMGRFLSHDSQYSWDILARLQEIADRLNYPLCISTSRKGFLGGSVSERDPLSQLTGLAAHLKGAHLIRTHNVGMAKSFFDAWRRITENSHHRRTSCPPVDDTPPMLA